ncbi:MAG: DegT/DnrJ/EryC1/StrS aminotransferase family protein [Candidatus Omnitrophica bacterium]|nr:DegT/DnrJ/EryC1/StrS aminotransferase family protein [Candidatus Omnitrophota bacterium]
MKDNSYKKVIASILECNQDQVFLYWKGRVALYAILKAMGVQKDDEIILPAFTCVVIPNAILYLGAKPIYVDISPENYNINIDLLEKTITTRTKVIICQNTFGLSSNIEQMIQIAKRHNLFSIEDCTHGFSGYYNGNPNGSYCDAAFYSTQWNKPFSTGIGGFLVVNNQELIKKVEQLEGKKIKPSLMDKTILAFLLFFNHYFVNRYTYWTMIKFYRFLSKNNLIIGSNQGGELSGVKIPKDYFKDISSVQVNAGIRQLKQLDKVNKLRKNNALEYTQFLKDQNKTFVSENLFDNHLFLKYPLLVKDRELFFRLAEREKISLGDWFLSPLHPIKGNLELWEFNLELFSYGSSIAKKIVNLPTDIEDNSKVLKFLTKNIKMIE